MTQELYRQVTDAAVFGRVAVLMGGMSAEREISLLTGDAVLKALKDRGVDAHAVDVDATIVDVLLKGNFDRVFIGLHGRGGEDGTIQGLLETLGLPYTGSGVAGSALAMDKLRTKQLLRGANLPTPEWWALDSEDTCQRLASQLAYPVIVKPALEGSSIGMARVDAADELLPAWRTAAQSGSPVLAEQWVTGPEYTVAILHDAALPLVRIVTDHTFYDYEAKYFSDKTDYVCPAGLSREIEQQYADLAIKTFDCVGAQGWGRVDFMVDEQSGAALILEVNTVPGMTSHSLVPMAAAEAGIDMGGLAWRILETSFVARPGSLNQADIVHSQEKGNAA